MLTSTTRALLEVLDEGCGLMTGQVSRRAKFSYGGNARMRSGAVRSWLNNLKAEGLVDLLDDQKPVCWKRTPAGTRALNN